MADRIVTGWRWGAGGFAGCAAVVGAAYALQAQTVTPAPDAAPPNVSISGVPLAGKSREEVGKIAAELGARLGGYPAVVSFQKRTERTSLRRLGGTVDVKGAVDAVFDPAANRKGLLQRAEELIMGPRKRDVPLAVLLPEDAVARSLMR